MSALRACPTHHVKLTDELVCRIGRGRHVCERWLVIEARNGKPWAIELTGHDGTVQEFDLPLSEVPKMSLNAQAAPPATEKKAERERHKTSTNHASARFVAGKQVLIVALVERHDIRDDATRFRVRWTLQDGKTTKRGYSAATDSHGEGMAAWQREVAKAQQAKWTRQEARGRLELRPVPAPR